MKSTEFIGKFKSWYLWGNLLGMLALIVVLFLGLRYALSIYTHHGESITIPNLKHKQYSDIKRMLEQEGLEVEVIDTGYIKSLPDNCVLEQSPKAGERVKSGRIVYLTINSTQSPQITIPDVIDNSSLREAMAKLQSMGFKLSIPEQVAGEKDWVYGIKAGNRLLRSGDKVAIDIPLTILVGNGMRSASDSVNYVEPGEEPMTLPNGETDDFEEVPQN